MAIAIGGSFSLDTPGSPNAGYTTRVTYIAGDLIIADQLKAVAGAISAGRWVDAGGATQVTGITIVLKPAAGAGSPVGPIVGGKLANHSILQGRLIR